MGNIGKWAAMHKGWVIFEGLHEVWLQCIFQYVVLMHLCHK